MRRVGCGMAFNGHKKKHRYSFGIASVRRVCIREALRQRLDGH